MGRGDPPRARLVAAALGPLRVQGTGFAAGEWVLVTVTPSIGEAITHRVRAGRGGSFTVTVPGVDADGGFEAVAAGSAGGHASFQYSTAAG